MSSEFQPIPANACEWEAEKIMYIFKAVREQLGVDLWGDAQTGVNPHSGYSWVWSEHYPVSFYMPISCQLTPGDVWILYSDPDTGGEHEKTLVEFASMDEILAWVDDLEDGNDT